MSPTSRLSRNSLGSSADVVAAIVSLLGCHRVALEPTEPIARERKPTTVEPVEAAASAAQVAEEPRRLELLQMPRCPRPGMGEQPRDCARAHLAAGTVET